MMSKTSEHESHSSFLEKEAILFSRYLLDRDPPREMVNRYISANRQLGLDVMDEPDGRIMEFSLSHPWLIPYLDAAAGLLMSDALLRKKIYVMAAVLEASPLFAKDFLPKDLSRPRLFVELMGNGLLAGIKMLIGMLLFIAVRGRKT